MNSFYRKLTVSTMMVLLIAPSWTYANEFFTIIGPDGRPMVVQKQSKKSAPSSSTVTKTVPQVVSPSAIVKPIPSFDRRNDQAIKFKPVVETSKTAETQKVVSTVNVAQPTTSSIQNKLKPSQIVNQSEKVIQKLTSSTKTNQMVDTEKTPVTVSSTSQDPVMTPEDSPTPTQTRAKNAPSDDVKAEVSQIDGVEYINNEYLENREFNLEGKKRFYVMPLYTDVQGGANAKIGHMETVEREKGVNQNFLNKIFNKEENLDQPLTLATTYYRISKENVEQNLEQSCFTGKKVNKAKILGQKNADIGLWPTAPLKDSFEYEIVQVEKNLKDVKLTSYATSQKAPVFYWPLVVFLDQKGCVIEGVGGFKNQDTSSTSLQYASIEGLIRLPEGTAYLFMTPLASAIDVEDQALSNHGQIKLSVLR